MSFYIFLLLNVLAVSFAMIGGVFMAFSDFIMRALAQSSGGAEAMQAINRTVFRWVFMTLFIGLAPVSLGLALYGALAVDGAPGVLLLAAGTCYLLGCFGVTVVRNVPLNEALAKMAASDPQTQAFWLDTYVPRWTFWNTVRTSACVVSALLVLAAMATMPMLH